MSYVSSAPRSHQCLCFFLCREKILLSYFFGAVKKKPTASFFPSLCYTRRSSGLTSWPYYTLYIYIYIVTVLHLGSSLDLFFKIIYREISLCSLLLQNHVPVSGEIAEPGVLRTFKCDSLPSCSNISECKNISGNCSFLCLSRKQSPL